MCGMKFEFEVGVGFEIEVEVEVEVEYGRGRVEDYRFADGEMATDIKRKLKE